MGKRLSLNCFILLLISSMAEIGLAAEDDEKELSASSELTNSKTAKELREGDEDLQTKNINVIPTPNKKRSVKMIIGGDSEGGVAKRVILPVKD